MQLVHSQVQINCSSTRFHFHTGLFFPGFTRGHSTKTFPLPTFSLPPSPSHTTPASPPHIYLSLTLLYSSLNSPWRCPSKEGNPMPDTSSLLLCLTLRTFDTHKQGLAHFSPCECFLPFLSYVYKARLGQGNGTIAAKATLRGLREERRSCVKAQAGDSVYLGSVLSSTRLQLMLGKSLSFLASLFPFCKPVMLIILPLSISAMWIQDFLKQR